MIVIASGLPPQIGSDLSYPIENAPTEQRQCT